MFISIFGGGFGGQVVDNGLHASTFTGVLLVEIGSVGIRREVEIEISGLIG